jgi:hypothetical protein
MSIFNYKAIIEKLISLNNIQEGLDSSFKEIQSKINELNNLELRLNKEFEQKDNNVNKKISEAKTYIENQIKKSKSDIENIIEEKTKGFPWLADAIAQYQYEYIDLEVEEFLRNKLRPAASTADRYRELALEKREIKRNFIIARNFVKYYEALAPWLTEYVGDKIDDALIKLSISDQDEAEAEEDPVYNILPKTEANEQLTDAERNQKALKLYWSNIKHRPPWVKGMIYERYIGYIYEDKGYSVDYLGIEKGFDDEGIDLICKDFDKTLLIQCKNWSKYPIHEKHINQLFGTTVKYFIEQYSETFDCQFDLFPNLLSENNIIPIIYSSGPLTEKAKRFAEVLNVKVYENFEMDINYPSIKCNISYDSNKKIYHLPFDQQYDTTKIDLSRGEFYAKTTKEAESKGFRRAWRWRGT